MHYALERNQLELYYQPIYNVSAGRIDKAEALLRWNHPEYGIVSPIDFIPIAERTRLILPITDWIIHQACRTLAEWDHNEYPLTLSINISFITINNRGEELYNLLKRELIATGINPDRLKFEITETSLVQDTAEVIRVFIRLKELGLKLALDDFGTGYSSFGYLKALPLDIVKIDRSLIRNLEVDNKSRMIVESMITVLHGLNLEVIVEGIETVGQYEILESMKADAIQGYLFSKPIRINEFKEYYQNAINDDFLPVKNRTKDDVEIVLHWRNEWNSGHPTIDDQHKILMKLAADLERCVLLECSNQQVITDQIDHILEELKKHFHDEEEILLKNSFPQYLEHQIEHQRLINQFNHLYDLYQKDEVNEYSFVKYIVREIIWEHLLKEDMKFFPYVTKVPSNQAINYIPTYFSEDNDLRENRDLLNFNLNLTQTYANYPLRSYL